MRLDARKLQQAIWKRQATVPSGESEGPKRARIVATPLEVPTREIVPIMVRMSSYEDDIPLAYLQSRAPSIGQPSEKPSMVPPTEASSSQAG